MTDMMVLIIFKRTMLYIDMLYVDIIIITVGEFIFV